MLTSRAARSLFENASALGEGVRPHKQKRGKGGGKSIKKRANNLSSLDRRRIFLSVSLSCLFVHGLKLLFYIEKLPSEAFSADLSIEEPIL